jgi:N-methylhydantoinase A
VHLERAADLRYEGQSYELTIPLRAAGPLDTRGLAALLADFHETHGRVYAYADTREPVEVISLRVAAIGVVPEVRLRRRGSTRPPAPRPKAERPVYFPGLGFRRSRVYERDALAPRQGFAGPCLIEETTSTTVVPPGWRGQVDLYGNLVITPAADARRGRNGAGRRKA